VDQVRVDDHADLFTRIFIHSVDGAGTKSRDSDFRLGRNLGNSRTVCAELSSLLSEALPNVVIYELECGNKEVLGSK